MTEARLMKVSEAARYVGRTEAALRQLVQRRQVPFRKVGRALFFVKDELDQWINTWSGLRPEDIKTW